MEKLDNGIISIGVNDHGAELASLIHRGRQYLWQADARFWKRHSPVLFPIVGSLWHGECRIGGEIYRMSQHGFARDMDFRLIDKTADSLTYRLEASAATRERYPYDFALEISYRLSANRLRVGWRVINLGDTDMPFQIGAHPAFYWPMLTDAEIDGGVDAMAPALAATDRRGYFIFSPAVDHIDKSAVGEGGCIGDVTTIELAQPGVLPLTLDTFGRDALVLEHSQVQAVTLCDEGRRPYLTLEFDAPALGLWSPPGKRAPFVCIEPWYGRADSIGFTGSYDQKPWTQTVVPGAAFDTHYDIIIH